jgi:hypothetical protein
MGVMVGILLRILPHANTQDKSLFIRINNMNLFDPLTFWMSAPFSQKEYLKNYFNHRYWYTMEKVCLKKKKYTESCENTGQCNDMQVLFCLNSTCKLIV